MLLPPVETVSTRGAWEAHGNGGIGGGIVVGPWKFQSFRPKNLVPL